MREGVGWDVGKGGGGNGPWMLLSGQVAGQDGEERVEWDCDFGAEQTGDG